MALRHAAVGARMGGAVDDALLVNRARAGDLDAYGQLYDRYFNLIYDFVWRVLRDADEAADVTQDVFMKAMQNLQSLAKAVSFKSWLFTIAHNSAVTRAERASRTIPLPQPAHEEAFGTFDVPDPARLNDPELSAGDEELATLVWEAAGALNPRDYALLDLHVRQGMESAEIAGVLGVSKGNAYTMVSRMRTAAGDVIGSYVVARRGSQDCEGLRATLQRFEFPPYTEEVRKAVDVHINECETCQAARRRLTSPLELLGGFAAVPAPLAVKGDIWGNLSSAWYVTGPGAIGKEGEIHGADGLPASPYGGGFDDDGGVVQPVDADDEGWDRSKLLWFAGAAVGLLIFAFAGGAMIAGALGDGGGEGASGPSATRTTTPVSTLTAGVVVNTPTPNLTPSATAPPAATATGTPTAVATPTPGIDVTATSIAATQTASAVQPTLAPPASPTRISLPTPTPRGATSPTPCSGITCPPTPGP
jgi:RNA polymerase sigma factor (sigma-70 family)